MHYIFLFKCIFPNRNNNFNIFIVFLISLLSIQNYLKLYGNKDHQSIVIDEFLGQYIALFSIPLFELENNIINISIIFLLFRFFDISKIGLRSVEKIPVHLAFYLTILLVAFIQYL